MCGSEIDSRGRAKTPGQRELPMSERANEKLAVKPAWRNVIREERRVPTGDPGVRIRSLSLSQPVSGVSGDSLTVM
jgi:hypothetical protein